MQVNRHKRNPKIHQQGPFSRRAFLIGAGVLGVGLTIETTGLALGQSSQVNIAQLIYGGGNWQPRPTALRRLAWEVHKRTAIDTVLEPTTIKPTGGNLANNPLIYLSGDRPFPRFEQEHLDMLSRYLKIGGTLIIDPAYTTDGDSAGFNTSVDDLLKQILPKQSPVPITPGHVLFRSFYDLPRPVGRRQGSQELTGYDIGGRMAVIRGDHDMGGAWARDNLGNWEYDVQPGGERQRENAFRLGINIIIYSLCLDYKNEQPHRRFSSQGTSGDQ